MLNVVSAGLWSLIAKKSRHATSRRAAIAYVSESSPITFGAGDILVVDASDASVKAGRTSAAALRQFVRAGAEIFSDPQLHAKVLLIDDWAIVGSGNASQQSQHWLIEAAIVTDRPDIAGQVEHFVSDLAARATAVDKRFLEHISALPVTRTSSPVRIPRPSAQRHAPSATTPRCWLVSLRGEATYHGNEDVVEKVAEQEQRKAGRRGGIVDWFFWAGRARFPATARIGDVVVECWRPRSTVKTTRSVRVFRHGRIVRIFQEPGVNAKTFHCLWPPDHERTALGWTEFVKLARRAGVRRDLSYRSTIELAETQSAALNELWPRSKR